MSTVLLDVMHTSMQFSDNTKQKQHDAHAIFERARSTDIHLRKGRTVAWITGTEAGMGASSDLRRALQLEAKAHDYRFFVKSDVWVAVADELVTPHTYATGWILTLESGTGSQHFSDRGIAYVSFEATNGIGDVGVGCSHFMTHGRKPGDEYYAANTRATRAVGKWGHHYGAGRHLAFFGSDTNIPDREDDVFRGQPFTTLADELHDWQNSGHGSIDVVASYNSDGRVKGKYWNVLDDKEFPLYTDHFATEGGFEVRQLAA